MREHCVQSFKLSRSRVPRFCGASRTSSRISPYGGFHQQTWEVNMIQPWKLYTIGDLSIKCIQICQTWCSMGCLKGTSTGHPWFLPTTRHDFLYRFPLNSGKFRSTEYLEGEGIDVATAPYIIITISESIVHTGEDWGYNGNQPTCRKGLVKYHRSHLLSLQNWLIKVFKSGSNRWHVKWSITCVEFSDASPSLSLSASGSTVRGQGTITSHAYASLSFTVVFQDEPLNDVQRPIWEVNRCHHCAFPFQTHFPNRTSVPLRCSRNECPERMCLGKGRFQGDLWDWCSRSLFGTRDQMEIDGNQNNYIRITNKTWSLLDLASHDHCWSWMEWFDAQNALGVQWDMDSASYPWECFTPLSSCLMPHVSITMGNQTKNNMHKKGNIVS